MIEFNGKAISKLRHAEKMDKLADSILLDGEEIIESYKNNKVVVIFTTSRTIIFNMKESGDRAISYCSISHRKVIVCDFHIFLNRDMDGKLELFVKNLGNIKFDFAGKSSLKIIARAISEKIEE